MKKIIYILPIFLGVLVLGGCGLNQTQQQTQTGDGNQNNQQQAADSGQNFVGKIKDAIALGTAMECTYNQDDFSGATWVKGQQIYSEFKSKERQGYLIMKDNCMWTWDGQGGQGIKMCYDPVDFQEMIGKGGPEGQQPGEPGKNQAPEVNYNCTAAVIGDEKFSPPSEVEFVDLQQMMPSGQ